MNATNLPPSTIEPVFIELNGRRLFTLRFAPTGPVRGAMLYLPPFAEEMNRCRSHVAAQARALAAAGHVVWLLDPFGCGESEGDIIDANWDIWVDDAIAALACLAAESGHRPALWSVRLGALLAIDVAQRAPQAVGDLLLWQPVADGKLFLTQYLRLRVASQMVNDGQPETTENLRGRLAAGEIIEVAGYPLAGSLAADIEARKLATMAPGTGRRIVWLEVVGKPEQALTAASRKAVAALEQAGANVAARTAVSPPIWQLHERADAPGLLSTSLDAWEASA